MAKQKALCVLLCLCMLSCLLAGCNTEEAAPKGTLTFTDAKGNTMASISSLKDLSKCIHWAYLDIALSEAIDAFSTLREIPAQEAQDLLFASDHTIRTAFDADVYTALANSASQFADANIGCAVTDLKGALVAVFSTASTGNNLAVERRSAHSAFKPLSVYAPALEKGIINWSTPYEDSPYKELTGDDGLTAPWPDNPTKTYTEQNTSVARAVAQSLNTVAVKCLADLGVMESITFLQENFGIPLVQEQQAAESYGEEEVIGSIALGELEYGVTPVEMAGYYQVFSNGGSYQAPKAVTEILDDAGNTLYRNTLTPKTVLSPVTADTMNKLLQGVVSGVGTGRNANCGDIQVAGKTGTGDDYDTCWFVGITPEYSCAVLMTGDSENRAPALFASAIKGIYEANPRLNKNFITHKNLYQVVYCTESGLAISDHCTDIDVGYYVNTDALAICNIHQ